MPPYIISLIAMLIISIIAFAAYGLDKRKAKKENILPPTSSGSTQFSVRQLKFCGGKF